MTNKQLRKQEDGIFFRFFGRLSDNFAGTLRNSSGSAVFIAA